jgi:uncharacterized protein (TIGR00369 family)
MDFEALRQGIGAAVPFAQYVGLEFESIEPGACTVVLPEDEQLRNHVGTQHAGALFTAAEAASGGAFIGGFAEQLGELRPLVRDASISYTKPARGPIRARARVEQPLDEVRAALARDGRADFEVGVELLDSSDEQVATMQVQWNVKSTRPAAAEV